jgi:hypothetical protein
MASHLVAIFFANLNSLHINDTFLANRLISLVQNKIELTARSTTKFVVFLL